jgi:signal transduction histidine kinase/CheY-like chemotaxis protein
VKDRENVDGFTKEVLDKVAGGGVWSGRVMKAKKDGTLYQGELTICPMRDQSGKIINFVAIEKDITYEVALESQIQQSQKMESVGRLAGGIAHDLNNYLGAITGFSELLRIEGNENEKLVKRADSIVNTSMKASSLIRQILAFSRKQHSSPEVLNLNAVLRDMNDLIGRLTGEDVEFKLCLKEDLWNVWIDRSQMEQILVNLLINAKEAMIQGGRMKIESENIDVADNIMEVYPFMDRKEYVRISVSDTGIGIPGDIRNKIFEPYFTTKEKDKNSGLGLSTVYGIIKQNGGYIWVNSEVGKGTTFDVYLPRCEEEVPAKIERPTEEIQDEKNFKKILLVEDNEELREAAESILETKGFRVYSSPNGKEALNLIDEKGLDIDLLIVDVVMPGMSGKEVAERVREKRGDVKVLFISGYTDDVILRKGITYKGGNFLQKPFSAGDLILKVKEVIG